MAYEYAMARQDGPWRHKILGSGTLVLDPDGLQLINVVATQRSYSDAQIDDFQVHGPHFLHRPPLRLSIQARFSHQAGELGGTAGFGFWNYPSAFLPRPPRAIWFFHGAPPNNIPLAAGVPGHGWKAATVDLGRAQALAWLPPAPFLAPIMRSRPGYRLIWPRIQRAIGVAEMLLDVRMDSWHQYEIHWGERTSSFFVDGQPLLLDAPSPRGPLCFVVWIDNQYLVATPQGRLRWGLVAAPAPQWLQIRDLRID